MPRARLAGRMAATMKCSIALAFGLAACTWAMPSGAQNAPASTTGTGTVTGHIVCGDTQRPARFAGVVLFGIPAQVTLAPAAPPDPNDMAAMKAALKASFAANLVQGETGLDGGFVLSDVAPGDYYAFPAVAGYVQPTAVLQAAYAAGADPKKPVPGIPVVHVSADRTADIELTAQRGATVSGHVVWDDGAPVARSIIQAEATGKEVKLPAQFAMLAGITAVYGASAQFTDDQGRYRITGLMPGEYVVKASLNTGTQFAMVGGAMQLGGLGTVTPLVIYAPDTVHKGAAQRLKLGSGDEHDGEDITIRLGGMHTVSGHIRSAEDGHGINSAEVKLTDASDKDFVRSAGVDANGSYTVTLVPPGTYNLTVTDAEDTRPSTKRPTGLIKMEMPDTVRSYDDGKGSVVVTDSDVSGEDVDLQTSQDVKKKPNLDDLLKE